MRLPSVGHVLNAAGRAFERFPFAILCAIAAAVTGILMTYRGAQTESLVRVMASVTLGLPLFFALAVTIEHVTRTTPESRHRVMVWVWRLIGATALFGFWLAWPHWTEDVQWRRYAQFSLGLHLAVAFLPFAVRRVGENAFWHYNRVLFVRFITAALYSGVLFGGLSLALVAVDRLLGVKIPEVAYPRLWCVIAFVFNTWFFLGGAPDDLDALEARDDYPIGLKVFSQYILVPLVAIYMAILLVYLGRVVITSQWPSGWIGWLVSWVAVVGILSLLLIHPVRERVGQGWVRVYARGFYVALLPPIVMLLMSIGKRIGQYGVTEDRYFLVVLSVWLAGVAGFYIVRREGSIRIIPMSLCAVAFVTAFGPWGAYSVSRGSQVQRLRGLLERHALLSDGHLVKASGELPLEDRREISAATFYLLDRHGRAALRGVTTDAPWPDLGKDTVAVAGLDADAFVKRLGFRYVEPRSGFGDSTVYVMANVTRQVNRIAGFDYETKLQTQPWHFDLDGERVDCTFDTRARAFRLQQAGREALFVPLEEILERARLQRLETNQPIPDTLLTVTAENDWLRARVDIENFQAQIRGDSLDVGFVNGKLYLKLLGQP